MMARPITGEQLSSWRAEAEALDALVERGNDRRARMAVMDVSVVLALLDEIDRLNTSREVIAVALRCGAKSK
jgi:hypothetical protein